VECLRLNTLRGTKTDFLTPKRYDEHPRPFYMGDPTGVVEYVRATESQAAQKDLTSTIMKLGINCGETRQQYSQ